MRRLASIVIPVFNGKTVVVEAVMSAAAQTHRDTEVILVDDGSTDGSAAAAAAAAPGIRVITQRNAGVSAARNAGLAAASGDYIQYLDHDDILAPDAVERRIDALERTDADVAYSGWRELRPAPHGGFEAGELKDRRIEDADSDPEIAILKGFWVPPASILYRRSVVEKIGPWKEWLPIIQDARYFLDAAMAGARFTHVPGAGSFYRTGQPGGSLSSRDRRQFLRDCLSNAKDVQRLWEKDAKQLTAARQSALVSVYSVVARDSRGRDEETFAAAFAALKSIDPFYCPRSPRALRVLSRIIGYPQAESVAVVYRKVRSALTGGGA